MASSAETRWWPSRFGAEDQLGMLNHVTDGKRLEALGLVRILTHPKLRGATGAWTSPIALV